jgi:hypothetical protein
MVTINDAKHVNTCKLSACPGKLVKFVGRSVVQGSWQHLYLSASTDDNVMSGNPGVT